MTAPRPQVLPFYHPDIGWVYGNEIVTSERAQSICEEWNVPFHEPSFDDPDIWHGVLDTRIAGSCFIPGCYDVISKLSPGDELRMEREDNPHDRYALALYSGDSKVGYVPRKDNQVIARLMEIRDLFNCTVTSVEDVEDVRIRVSAWRGKKVRRHFSFSFDAMCGTFAWIDAQPVLMGYTNYTPMTDKVLTFDLEYHLSDDDLWNLSWGHESPSMDDRWNFFMDGDRLYVTRSWTGFCVFVVEMDQTDVLHVTVENDPERCTTTLEEARKTIRELLDVWTAPVPVPSGAMPYDVFGNAEVYDGEGWFEVKDGGVVIIHSGKPPE